MKPQVRIYTNLQDGRYVVESYACPQIEDLSLKFKKCGYGTRRDIERSIKTQFQEKRLGRPQVLIQEVKSVRPAILPQMKRVCA